MKLQGKRIFIVEDDMRNRLVYKLLLPKHGAEVEYEGWGPDALHHLERWQPVDLIILDLMLQRGTSGYELFEAIRGRPEFAHVPIVAVSAAEPSAAIARARQLGFSGFISKPIHQDRLPDQLARLIAGEQIWDTGSRLQTLA